MKSPRALVVGALVALVAMGAPTWARGLVLLPLWGGLVSLEQVRRRAVYRGRGDLLFRGVQVVPARPEVLVRQGRDVVPIDVVLDRGGFDVPDHPEVELPTDVQDFAG